MKKFGLAILILTAMCIVALAFFENEIDGWLHDSAETSRTTFSTTSSSMNSRPTTSSPTSSTAISSATTSTTQTTTKPIPVCAHEWIFEFSTVTCSKDGEKLYRCAKCEEVKTENDPAYGCYDEDKNGLCDGCGIVTGECEHKFVTEKGYAATCTQNGLSDRRYCTKCNMVLNEHTAIPALGHERTVIESVPSTCISEGLAAGERCSRCELILVPQAPLPLGDHVGDEGVCTVCNTMTDPKLALGFYIVRNGTKKENSDRYVISKYAERFSYTGFVNIEFDPKTSELVFSGDSTTLGIDGSMVMVVDMNSPIQRIDLQGTYQGINGCAVGPMDPKKYSQNYMYLETFEYDVEISREDEELYEAYFSIAISEMLVLSAELMAETNVGMTMPMLGFVNY